MEHGSLQVLSEHIKHCNQVILPASSVHSAISVNHLISSPESEMLSPNTTRLFKQPDEEDELHFGPFFRLLFFFRQLEGFIVFDAVPFGPLFFPSSKRDG